MGATAARPRPFWHENLYQKLTPLPSKIGAGGRADADVIAAGPLDILARSPDHGGKW
jgi:hypothetical protein